VAYPLAVGGKMGGWGGFLFVFLEKILVPIDITN
jgi:hypothetical protein